MHNRLRQFLGINDIRMRLGLIWGIRSSAIFDRYASALFIVCLVNKRVRTLAYIACGLNNEIMSLWNRAWNRFGHPAAEGIE